MNIEELKKLVQSQRELGLSVTVLTMTAPVSLRNRAKYPKQVRTPFGLCRWHHHKDDRIVVYVETEKLEAFIRRLTNSATCNKPANTQGVT